MRRSSSRFLDVLAYTLCTLFALDRLLKFAAVIHFFRPPPPPQPTWPQVTLLQPITRGASSLPAEDGLACAVEILRRSL